MPPSALDDRLAALDDRATVERLDPHGLLARIEALPDQSEEAWRAARALSLREQHVSVHELLVLGMGGSAIAGEVVRTLAAGAGRMPVHVSRNYDLPAFASEQTLVVACSHSGETEETLSAFGAALEARCPAVVVTTGGRLLDMARERDVPSFTYRYDGEPRSALGWQLMALLAVAGQAGVLDVTEAAVGQTIDRMRNQRHALAFDAPSTGNLAKQLAGRLFDRLPVIVGAEPLAVAAQRWRTQLNENAKVWALHDELPELDHNTIVGFALPREIAQRVHVILLWHEELLPRMRLRYEATEAALTEAGVSSERVVVSGEGTLARVLAAVQLGDFVSYYLALLNGVAPSPVTAIDSLKVKLAGP